MSDFTDWAGSVDGTVVPGGTPAVDSLTKDQGGNPFLQPLADATPAIKATVGTKPETNAQNQQNAAKLNVPVPAVEADPEGAKNTVRTNDILNMVKDTPSTNMFLANADNAGVAHSSVEQLTGMERTLANRNATPEDGYLDSFMKTMENVLPGLKNDAGTIGQFFADRLSNPAESVEFNNQSTNPNSLYGLVAEKAQPMADLAQKISKAATADIQANQPNVPEGSLRDWSNKITEGLVKSLPALAAGLITKGVGGEASLATGVGAAVGGVQAGAEAYGEARNDYDLDPAAARARGLVFGIATAIPQTLPLGSILSGGKFLPGVLKTIGLDGMSNAFTQMIQDGYDKQTIKPDMTWGQAWDNMKTAGIVGAVTGAASHLFAHPFVKHMDNSADGALSMKDTVDEMHKQATAAPIADIDPYKLGEAATQQFENQGITKVQMDSQGLSKIAEERGEDPATFMTKLGVKSDQALNAAQMGTDVEVGIKEFVDNVFVPGIKDPKLYDDVTQHTRWDPEGLTPAEAEQWKQNGLAEELRRVAEAPENMNDTHEVTPEHIEALKEAGFSDEDIRGFTPKDVSDLTGMSTEKMRRDLPVVLAETEMGFQGLFRNANEAGWTDKQFADQMARQQKARQVATTIIQKREVGKQLKKATEAYKEQRAVVEDSQKESVGNQQVYQAINNLGRERLDRAKVEDALPDVWTNLSDENDKRVWSVKRYLADIPTQEGARNLFTEKGVPGIDPEIHALQHGYPDAATMVKEMIVAPEFKDAVKAATDREMAAKHGELGDEVNRYQEALQAVHNSPQVDVLAHELNALQAAKKGGRINATLVRRAAYAYIQQNLSYKDIQSTKFTNAAKKMARQSYKAFRAGDIEGASQAKAQQLLNVAMAQQAYKIRATMDKQQKYMKQFTKSKVEGLPEVYLNLIKPLLAGVNFTGKPLKFVLGDVNAAARGNKSDWAKAFSKAVDDGNAFIDLPDKLAASLGKTQWSDLALEDFQALHDTIKQIDTVGRNGEKLRKAGEKQDRKEASAELGGLIEKNVKQAANPLGVRTPSQKAIKAGREFAAAMINMDSVMAKLDGFSDQRLGRAYDLIKGRIDQALHHGYGPNQIGYQDRAELEAGRIHKLYSGYTLKELSNWYRKNIQLPGFSEPESRDTLVAIMKNLGNEGNKDRLLKSGRVTQEMIDSVKKWASEKDIKHVQDTWDYLEEFRPEIQDTHERRTGYKPKMVEASPVEWGDGKGTTKGGYYPIAYDNEKAHSGESPRDDSNPKANDITKFLEDQKYGRNVASQTTRGHYEARTGGNGRELKLSNSVLNAHVQKVIFDLHMGDALSDAYRIVNDPAVKKAFDDKGRTDIHNDMNLWLEDTIMRERAPIGAIENTIRYIRKGYTVSKLGFNIGTAGLQILGLNQTAIHIGWGNMFTGMWAVTRGQFEGPDAIVNKINEESRLMAHRDHNWINQSHKAATDLTQSWLRAVPTEKGKAAAKASKQFLSSASFYALLKVQRLVDMITYTGARAHGLEMFKGDEKKAIMYAERMVAQAQGSSIFSDRSGWERGTTNEHTRQSEFVKSMSPLISYVMAKNNVAYQLTGRANLKNPGQLLRWAANMAALYAVEGMVTGAVYSGLPDGDDPDKDGWTSSIIKSSLSQMAAGIPGVATFAQAAQGFRPGGSFAATAAEYGELWKSVSEGQMTEQTAKLGNDLLGTAFHYPSSQAFRAAKILNRANDPYAENLEWYEYMFGPQWKSNR